MSEDARGKARGFLRALGYGQLLEPADQRSSLPENPALLLRAADRIGGIFRLHARHAPGLVFFGGTAAPADGPEELSASLNGAGETPREAFEACVGEGVEYLSQFRRADDAVETLGFADFSAKMGADAAERLLAWIGTEALDRSPALECVAATRLTDGEPGWLPAALVLREPRADAARRSRLAVGCGCAAGPDWTAAVTSALCEVVERDAVAMWWSGGRAGRPVSLEALAASAAGDLIGRIGQGKRARHTTLVDIAGDPGLPCIAAVSFDSDGGGFAAGFACRTNAASACRAAIIEMCQMELGHDVVAAKRSRLGADSLNEADLRQERRAGGVSWDQVELLSGFAGPISIADTSSADAALLETMPGLLAARGFHAYAVDLTRAEFGIPVARVVVPGLQPYPSTFVSRRLAASAGAAHNSPYAKGIELF